MEITFPGVLISGTMVPTIPMLSSSSAIEEKDRLYGPPLADPMEGMPSELTMASS
jgi:hypothetical protein